MRKNERCPAPVWIELDLIRISERRRRSINRATVERYRRWLEQGREAPPVRLARLGDTYVVRDGRHRVAAALAAGHELVEARCCTGYGDGSCGARPFGHPRYATRISRLRRLRAALSNPGGRRARLPNEREETRCTGIWSGWPRALRRPFARRS